MNDLNAMPSELFGKRRHGAQIEKAQSRKQFLKAI
jgi:hypothetical protein